MSSPVPGSALAFELNDALLAVADHSGVLATEPGYAVVEAGNVRLGFEALPVLRLNAHLASTRHWRDLGSPLPRPLGTFATSADLVAAHLTRLWNRHGTGRPGVRYALPPYWSDEQRAELFALSARNGIPALAAVDGAVAASRHAAPGRELLHLEASLHGATLRRIRQSDTAALGDLPADRDFIPSLGIEPLVRLAMDIVARRFVECSRYDPLHDSASEQVLFDQLPGWFARFAGDADVPVELATRSGTFSAVIRPADVRRRMAMACEPLLQRLRASVAARGPHVLELQPRLAEIPGVIDALLRLSDVAVHVLPPGAAALGLARATVEPARAAGHVVVLAELPWDPVPAGVPVAIPDKAPVAATLPTHLLAGHRAYRLGPGPFRIGSELKAGEAGVVLPPSLPGLSRLHCTLRRENGALFVFDHSRFGTQLNGHRIDGTALLEPGDVLSIGTPAIELRLLSEVDGPVNDGP